MSAWDARVGAWGAHMFHGRHTLGPDAVQLMSNDYLALARHPELIAAQVAALTSAGAGMMMSGVFCDEDDPQRALTAEFAEFLQAPAVVLCQSGFEANVGLLDTLLAGSPKSWPVYLDWQAHASLWPRLRERARPFRHNNLADLRRLIAADGPGLICVDTVYSVSGDVAPLRELVELCEEFECQLVADESHALGVYGPRGAGLAVAEGLAGRIAFRTASLAKAFCGRAGIIACDQEFAEFFPYHSTAAIFSSTLLPHDLAGLHATLQLIRNGGPRRDRLWAISERLHAGLRHHGWDTGNANGPIVPLQIGAEPALVRARRHLDTQGVAGAPFVAPATHRDRSVLRLTAHAALTDNEIDRVIAAVATLPVTLSANA